VGGAEAGADSLASPGTAPATDAAVATAASGSASAKATHATAPAAKPKPAAPAADAPCPGPGLTRRCNGRCVNIQTDDHNCGSCGTVCASGKHCDGHMFCRDSAGNL